MKKIILIFIIGVLGITSCKLLKKDAVHCLKLKKALKEVWHYDSTNNIYVFNKAKTDLYLKYKPCLYGLTKDEVIELLGKPSYDGIVTLRYYTYKGCHKKPIKRCDLLNIVLDEKTNTVIKITEGGFEAN